MGDGAGALLLAASAAGTTTTTPAAAWSSSRRVLVAHWRAGLVALRLAGVLGCSGWPPRWSRPWTRYGCASLVAFTAARVALFTRQFFTDFKPQIEEARKESYPGEIAYIFWIDAFNLVIQDLTISLTQVVMLLYSRDVSLLVRAVFLYLHSFPGPRNKNARRRAVVAWFGAHFTFYAAYGLSYTDNWERAFYILNDLLPHVLVGATQDSFLHIVSANADLLASIADGVLEHVASLSHLAQSAAPCTCSSTCPAHCSRVPVLLGEQRVARALLHGLRALRVRYQSVQDVVRATNRAYGGYNLLASTTALIGGVAFLYTGVIAIITLAGILGEYKEPLPFDALDAVCCLALGTLQTARLLFTCAIGEQMSLESFRISSALQTGLTRHAGIDPRIEREIQWFIRQTQMQEIRFGVFDLLYFDLKTMNRVIAAMMSNIVILVQFSALSSGIT
ncbi:Gustatory receptor 66 [Frankliniella occidentalis]|nr:Gustatory receptor 66 [Frankliniella occidentalis]